MHTLPLLNQYAMILPVSFMKSAKKGMEVVGIEVIK
jgi:hypothetical protein